MKCASLYHAINWPYHATNWPYHASPTESRPKIKKAGKVKGDLTVETLALIDALDDSRSRVCARAAHVHPGALAGVGNGGLRVPSPHVPSPECTTLPAVPLLLRLFYLARGLRTLVAVLPLYYPLADIQ